jgi:inorganic triphosphatase YgiF
MGVDDRIREVDKVASQAVVSLAGMTQDELMLAQQLCDHFELQLGTLVRRADAIRLLGDTETTTQRLQEAAQHLIYR